MKSQKMRSKNSLVYVRMGEFGLKAAGIQCVCVIAGICILC